MQAMQPEDDIINCNWSNPN